MCLHQSLDQSFEFANQFAPEHLILNLAQAEQYIDLVKNAGSVFVGPYSCESAGDYASGTNHTLPTYGFARAYSGVNLASYCKQITFQQIDTQGVKNLKPVVSLMAEQEGLEAHKKAMEIRDQ